MLRYIVYARKSTESADRQVLSIPAQLKELRELATRDGIVIAEELTESCSAKEPGRPVFSRLLGMVQSGKVDGILCWKLDRLARNSVDGGALNHFLGKGRLKEIRCPDGTYTGTGDSRFMLSVLFGAATKMVDDLSVAVRRGNRELAERGRVAARTPLGYLKVRDPHLDTAGRAVPDPDRFHLVERIWRDMLTGSVTVHEVWRRAVGWGLTSRGDKRHPAGPVKVSQVIKLLRMRFYAGQIVHAGKTYEGDHRAMISPEEFERVQRIVRRKTAARPSVHAFPYRGLLHCGHCGRVLTGEEHRNRQGHLYTYYRCARRRPGYPMCHALAPSETQVTADITAALEKLALDPELAAWSVAAVDWWAAEEKEGISATTQAAERDLRAVVAELRRADQLLVKGVLAEDRYLELRGELAAQEARLRSTLNDPVSELAAWQAAVREAVDFGASVSSAFEKGTADERRDLIARLYENFTYSERKPAPQLCSEYSLLAAPRPIFERRKGRGANLPHPSAFSLRRRENTRPVDARLHDFSCWSAKLHDVRTRSIVRPQKLDRESASSATASHETRPI
jgi:site-specific DNA recombinase